MIDSDAGLPNAAEDVMSTRAASFMAAVLGQFCGVPHGARILDFGCGSGELVHRMRRIGFDAWGCDNGAFRSGDYKPDTFLAEIGTAPYRLPYPDSHFDAVISTSVLEHARNKPEAFAEIRRVLRPGGVTVHLFPSKWYLPSEPHIYVPLVNWLWPYVPRWWLAIWAILGIRNEFQRGLSWRETVQRNFDFCRNGLDYWPASKYERVLSDIFDNCTFASRFYLENSPGGAARLIRMIPLSRLGAHLLAQTRMQLLVAWRRTADP